MNHTSFDPRSADVDVQSSRTGDLVLTRPGAHGPHVERAHDVIALVQSGDFEIATAIASGRSRRKRAIVRREADRCSLGWGSSPGDPPADRVAGAELDIDRDSAAARDVDDFLGARAAPEETRSLREDAHGSGSNAIDGEAPIGRDTALCASRSAQRHDLYRRHLRRFQAEDAPGDRSPRPELDPDRNPAAHGDIVDRSPHHAALRRVERIPPLGETPHAEHPVGVALRGFAAAVGGCRTRVDVRARYRNAAIGDDDSLHLGSASEPEVHLHLATGDLHGFGLGHETLVGRS